MRDITMVPSVDEQRIKGLRTDQELRIAEVARRAGLSAAQVYRLEAGERPYTAATTLARVALALGTSVEFLLGLTDDQRSWEELTCHCEDSQAEPAEDPPDEEEQPDEELDP